MDIAVIENNKKICTVTNVEPAPRVGEIITIMDRKSKELSITDYRIIEVGWLVTRFEDDDCSFEGCRIFVKRKKRFNICRKDN